MKQFIQQLLTDCLADFRQRGLVPQDFQPRFSVESTRDKKNGDIATNLAMVLCKKLGKKPLEAAELIIASLPKSDRIEKVEVAGPGFINFFMNSDHVGARVYAMSQDPRLGVEKAANPQVVVVDYSSPNVAKEMAVHHIRSTVIGDSVVRVLEFLGHKVIRANHVGDWGTQFGMLIAYLEKMENESASDLEISDLEAFYRQAKVLYDEDEEFATRARGYVVKLQGGDEYCRMMWQKLVRMTMTQNQRIYDRLNVSLKPENVMGESMYNAMLPAIAEDLEKRGMAVTDDGALVVYLDEFRNKDGNPMGVIIRKKDGGFLYTTTDIACARYRVEELHADRVLYFIDSRQHDHLMQAWTIARKAGYVPENVSLEHESFGMMLGKDGRPFKTRSGGTVKLSDLLDEAETRVGALLEARGSDLAGEERERVIHEVAMGAVKYADLSKNRTTDYIFDWDTMLSFDGNTAPYLQYAYTRISSVLRKAETEAGPVRLGCAQEEKLALKLLQFAETVQQVAQRGMPHLLCAYLYELSGLFMSFYEACPVNRGDVEESVRASRLSLCRVTGQTVKTGLSLLGINVLERM
ncbi:MAG: arginine--tRNA ligase [Succinivibrionaceae bacterium]|nr:arginine--tRNA ligase [Succinivibrionaceae bacterium]